MKNKKAQRDEEIKMKMCAHKMVFIMFCLVPVFTLAHAHVPNLILVRYQVGGGGGVIPTVKWGEGGGLSFAL